MIHLGPDTEAEMQGRLGTGLRNGADAGLTEAAMA